MCRLCRWIEARLFPPSAARGRTVQEKVQDLHYAQTNDREVIDRDPDRDALVEIDRVWRRDPEAAFPRLSALAECGSVWSMLLVGYAYEVGMGIAADTSQAESWYRRASEGDCQQAQLRLGRIYAQRGDYSGSEMVYGVGVAEHWAPAMYYLAHAKLRQPKSAKQLEEARALLEQASELGDLAAKFYLAHLSLKGRFGWRRIPSGLRLAWDAGKRFFALENEAVSVSHSKDDADVPPA